MYGDATIGSLNRPVNVALVTGQSLEKTLDRSHLGPLPELDRIYRMPSRC
jgi:hypothetical protein